MARVKLTEYRAKSILTDHYNGYEIRKASLQKDIDALSDDDSYVVKVDQGVKKRGKQGLVELNITKVDIKKAATSLINKGFNRLIVETMIPHNEEDERYLCIERVRAGFRILYSPRGGVHVEEDASAVEMYTDPQDVPLPTEFVESILQTMDQEHLSFVEINPLLVRDNECILLDAAVLADSAGMEFSSWGESDVVDPHTPGTSEKLIMQLNSGSAASFSFRVLNQDGSIWLLLSGGGASITIADEASNRGKADYIGNYGEYSGGPTREETQVYTDAVLKQMFNSKAPRKALVIAGGVANFTDVKKTFAGIIDALRKHIDELQKQQIKVYVRRGGPNEKEGLALMEEFLRKSNIYGSVHGSTEILTVVVDEAMDYVDK